VCLTAFCLPSPAADGLNKGNRRNLTCEYRRPEQHRNSVSASASDRSWYGFYDLHLRSPFQSRPDVVLLLLSLKLITTLPPTSPRNPRTPLYHAVKHFCLQVEGSSIFSLPVLQAAVLIALYELGHGIYPAAFLSIGVCARYAHALGINCSRSLQTRRVLTLVEVEERRKIWWAIVILDRLVPSPFYPLYDSLATIIGPILMAIIAS